jgi:hypothetical protein
MHKPKEKLEILLRTCPELSKIKSGSRSTHGIHYRNKTKKNIKINLSLLKKNIGQELYSLYSEELIRSAPWPTLEHEDSLVVKLPK